MPTHKSETVFCTSCPIRLVCFGEDTPPEENQTADSCPLARLYYGEATVSINEKFYIEVR